MGVQKTKTNPMKLNNGLVVECRKLYKWIELKDSDRICSFSPHHLSF